MKIGMVGDKVRIRKKYRRLKRGLFVFGFVFILAVIIVAIYFFGFYSNTSTSEYVLENPLSSIVFANTNVDGKVDKEAVVLEGIKKFNSNYINYMLIALGVGELHTSLLRYGAPRIEFYIDDESWYSELKDGALYTQKGTIDDEDLIIRISRRNAVEALLAKNIEDHMRKSVESGKIQLELIAGKPELLSKGYLSMYAELTGEEVDVE
jgi:hypothetical protein